MNRTVGVCLLALVPALLADAVAGSDSCRPVAVVILPGQMISFDCTQQSCAIACGTYTRVISGSTYTTCECNGFPPTCCTYAAITDSSGNTTFQSTGNCSAQDVVCQTGNLCTFRSYMILEPLTLVITPKCLPSSG